MSIVDGFYNLVTDGTYFYTSNTLQNVVCRINQSGTVSHDFIVVDKPICVAITNYTQVGKKQKLFVQTLYRLFVYEFTTPTTVVQIRMMPFGSSSYFPSMIHDSQQDKLYISNYEQGTITVINSAYASSVYFSNPLLQGVSGMAIASNLLYVSNYEKNKIFIIDGGILREYLSMNYPRGIFYSEGRFYICYGNGVKNGIYLHNYASTSYVDVFSDFLFKTVPLNTLLYSNALYITLENSNVIYRNKDVFAFGDFKRATFYNASTLTQSVIAMNPNCVANPAYQALIQLRTIGSNTGDPIEPITSLEGRLRGTQIPFNVGLGSDYESLKMRRKAETLKFRNSANNPGIVLSTKELYASVMKNGGPSRFSKAKLAQVLKANNGKLPCDIGINNGNPIVITPPSNSGIHDSTFEGYYLNPYVAYYPSL
jgi:hypothetical protein